MLEQEVDRRRSAGSRGVFMVYDQRTIVQWERARWRKYANENQATDQHLPAQTPTPPSRESQSHMCYWDQRRQRAIKCLLSLLSYGCKYCLVMDRLPGFETTATTIVINAPPPSKKEMFRVVSQLLNVASRRQSQMANVMVAVARASRLFNIATGRKSLAQLEPLRGRCFPVDLSLMVLREIEKSSFDTVSGHTLDRVRGGVFFY